MRRKYRSYLDENLDKALRLIAAGKILQKKASIDFNIPRQILNRPIKRKNNSKKGVERPTTLAQGEEKLLLSGVVDN